MDKRNQRGVALVLTMILLAVVSVMAVSMMFLSQSETWSTMNYRLMTQARDGAEAGLNRAANYLIYTYVAPTATSVPDPINAYDINASPVTDAANGIPVVLSAHTSDQASNYPVPEVQTDFDTTGNGKGSLAADTTTLNYATYAQLLSMRQVVPYGQTTPETIQRWEITSDATIAGVQNATVRVAAILDQPIAPTFSYAAFGTSDMCDPSGLIFGGGAETGSYDSSTYGGSGEPTTSDSNGDVGTNGNLTLSGTSSHIYGSLSTPRTGVGDCADGAAETVKGNPELADGQVQLPQEIDYPPPAFPTSPALTNPAPNQSTNGTCGSLPNCTQNGNPMLNDITLGPGAYGNLSITGGAKVHLTAGSYSINSISLAGNSQIIIDSGPVIFNVGGCVDYVGDPPTACNGYMATPLDFTGGTFTNSTYNPMNFQIQYAGTGELKLNGGSAAAAVVYAPSAEVTLLGGFNLYGSVIGKSIDDSGGANIYYDLALQKKAFSIGNYLLQSFTWSKF